MSGIVLSAAVRQNLLSLQSTAELLSTTQNRLASGKKVNTAITSLQKLVDTARSIANQVLQTTVGYSPKSTVSSSAALGGTAANLVDGVTIKAGDVLTIASTGGGTPTSITFGANESLDQLNAALAPNNLSAGLDASNKLVITTLNDAASKTVGAITYTNTGGGTVTFGAV